jgi:hypothetical protein
MKETRTTNVSVSYSNLIKRNTHTHTQIKYEIKHYSFKSNAIKSSIVARKLNC